MSVVTKELLQELGIQLQDEDYALLADHFDTTLQDRVIEEIVLELNPEQAHQLAEMQASSDDELLTWLHANVPELAIIVSDEVDILLGELAENSEAIGS